MEIQESLNNKIEEHNSIYEDTAEPIILTNDIVQEILSLSGVPEEITTKIEKSYTENFGDTPPVADILLDNKALAAKAQKKKEEMLEKQVRILENKLERVTQDISINSEIENTSLELDDEAAVESDNSIDNLETEQDAPTDITENYDIVLKVKPEKVQHIKSQIIDGKKYIVIPIDENEQTTVNGIDNLI